MSSATSTFLAPAQLYAARSLLFVSPPQGSSNESAQSHIRIGSAQSNGSRKQLPDTPDVPPARKPSQGVDSVDTKLLDPQAATKMGLRLSSSISSFAKLGGSTESIDSKSSNSPNSWFARSRTGSTQPDESEGKKSGVAGFGKLFKRAAEKAQHGDAQSIVSSSSAGQPLQKTITKIEAPTDTGRREISDWNYGITETLAIKVFGMSDTAGIKTLCLEDGLSADYICNDLENYLHILENDLSWDRPGDFNSKETYNNWKTLRIRKVLRVLELQSSSIHLDYQDGTLLTIDIEQAAGLLAKDKHGSSNPYAVISTEGRKVFQSPVVQRNLNPSWKFRVALLIRDPEESITISIWSKTYTESADKPNMFALGSQSADKFLGMVTLTGAVLLEETRRGKFQRWINLEKRSSSSNVAGKVLVSVERTFEKDMIPPSIYERAFFCIPPDPLNSFKLLLTNACEHEFQRNTTGKLSATTASVLKFVASSWQLTETMAAVIRLDVFASMYTKEAVGARTVYEDALLNAIDSLASSQSSNSASNVSIFIFQTAGSALYGLTFHQISTFFGQPAIQLDSSASEEFKYRTMIIQDLATHSLLAEKHQSGVKVASVVESLIKTSLSGRYHGLNGLAGATVTEEKDKDQQKVPASRFLVVLVGHVIDELTMLNTNFDMLLFGKLHIPTMAASVFLENLLPQFDGFARTYSTGEPDLEEAFTLYHHVRKLENLIDGIDYRYLKQFKINAWFHPFVCDWLTQSEKKIDEWVSNAVRLDDFVLSEVGYSSSVFDIFTSFQQQLEFLLKLNWPEEVQFRFFIFKYFENICEGIEKYISLMRQGIVADLNNPSAAKVAQPAGQSNGFQLAVPEAQKPSTAPTKKFQIKIRKFGPPIDGSELRIPPRSVTRVTNIHAILARLDALLDQLPESLKSAIVARTSPTHASPAMPQNAPTSPTSPTSPNNPRPLPPLPPRRNVTPYTAPSTSLRTPLLLSILSAHDMPVVRPLLTTVSISISSPAHTFSPNKNLGHTQSQPQNKLEFSLEVSSPGLSSSLSPFEHLLPIPPMQLSEIPVILTDKEIRAGLTLSLVHHVAPPQPGEGKFEDQFIIATSNLSIESIVGSINQGESEAVAGASGVVMVPAGGGSVMVRVRVAKEKHVEVIQQRVHYAVYECLHSVATLFADKVCLDLRTRLKDVSANQKKSMAMLNNLKSFTKRPLNQMFTAQAFKPAASSSQGPSEEEIHTAMAPLLDYINLNLASIAENAPFEPLARELVGFVWKRMLEVAESLLVPNLDDIEYPVHGGIVTKEKKAWDEARVIFLKCAMEILFDFLHSDGDGLPVESLNSPEFQNLMSMFEIYNSVTNRRDLIARHVALVKESGIASNRHDWLLKLIRLRGGFKEYIEQILVDRYLHGRGSL